MTARVPLDAYEIEGHGTCWEVSSGDQHLRTFDTLGELMSWANHPSQTLQYSSVVLHTVAQWEESLRLQADWQEAIR